MVFVESSMIYAVEYNNKTADLFVIFSNKDKYRYADVPPETVTEFLFASSVGAAFYTYIRDKFECTRVGNLVEVTVIDV